MERRPLLVVSVHDVSPATGDQTGRWCADADALGVPVSLLVIPGPWRGSQLGDAPDYGRVIRQRMDGGDEVVLHGWTHRAGSDGIRWRRAVGQLVARGAAEFAAIDEQEAADRLAAGRSVLSSVGLATDGFTPPGWLASPGSVRALTRAGFGYVTTHWGLVPLQGGGCPRRGFALSHRPGGGIAEQVGAALMRMSARRSAAAGGLVRIALHPDDLSRPGLRDTTLRSIEAVLAAGGRAVTYSQLAQGAA
jgi:predicted deacetylase